MHGIDGHSNKSALIPPPLIELDRLALSETAREAVVAAVTGEPAGTVGPVPSGAAAALRASLDWTAVLTAGERSLLRELLDRIADGG